MLLSSRTLPAWLLTPGIAIASVSLALFAWLRTSVGWGGYDLSVYLMGGAAWMDGASVFQAEMPTHLGPGHYTYPPVTLLGFGPLSELNPGIVHTLMTSLSLAALWGVVWLVLRSTLPASRGLVGLSLGITGGALWLQPVHDTIDQGQVNILLMFLVVADLLRRGRGQGVLIGIAAAVKVTPGIFILLLLLVGRTKAGLTAIATAAGLTGLGFVIAPRDSMDFWFQRFGDTAWMVSPIDPTDVQNQSLMGVLSRLSGESPLWLLVSVVVGALGLLLARRVYRQDPTMGVLVCAVTGLLISPLSWHEHWVWIVPVLVWLGIQARSSLRPHIIGGMVLIGMVFAVYPFEVSEGQRDALSILSPARSLWNDGYHNILTAGAGAAYVVVGLGLLAAAWVATRRANVLDRDSVMPYSPK